MKTNLIFIVNFIEMSFFITYIKEKYYIEVILHIDDIQFFYYFANTLY